MQDWQWRHCYVGGANPVNHSDATARSLKASEIKNHSLFVYVCGCRRVGFLDLALEKDYVRGKVTDYMNKLVNMGVAGFRVDACKHMWPVDLSAVYGRLNNLNISLEVHNHLSSRRSAVHF